MPAVVPAAPFIPPVAAPVAAPRRRLARTVVPLRPPAPAVPGRVGTVQRVVPHIRVPVQRLRIGEVRADAVRAEEPSQGGIVVARAVVEQPRPVPLLPRVVQRRLADSPAPDVAPRPVLLPVQHRPRRARRHPDAAEVVAVQVGEAEELTYMTSMWPESSRRLSDR